MEDIITQIIELHKELSVMNVRKATLEKPTLTAMDKITELYVRFNEIVPSSTIHAQIDKERMFVLIVALLYSPSCIGGEKMKNGLRGYLATTMNLGQEKVSKRFHTALDLFRFDKSFHAETIHIYKAMSESFDWSA